MNDKYLYKAKRIDNGEWVIGNRIDDYITGQVFIHAVGNSVNESNKIGEEGFLRFVAFEVDSSTICQCTGRNDEWEHDIFVCEEDVYEILYCEDSLSWIAASVFDSDSIDLGEFYQKDYICIGNEIDNPELLEV